MKNRTMTVREKAQRIARSLRKEEPDYYYLKELFRHLRNELNIKVTRQSKHLPYVPTEAEITSYYDIVFKSNNMQNVIIIKTLLYTGVRVGELVNIKVENVDLHNGTIRIDCGKGGKDRIVPFPTSFKEILAMHIERNKEKGIKRKEQLTYLSPHGSALIVLEVYAKYWFNTQRPQE